MTELTGGCHCGHIRYQIEGDAFDADYCHCRDCQQTTGAPVAAWLDIKATQLHWLNEKPTEYASSASIRRGFCSRCGCSISYRSSDHPQYLSLSIVSLDNPDAVSPKYHIHTASAPSWLKLDDAYPRYRRARSAG